MLSLNDREWKSFMLSDIFKVDLSKGDNQPSLLEEGQYPLITAGTKNNGVCCFIKEGDGKSQLFEKNAITVDMFGTPFYHAYDFYSVSHGRINILTAISNKFNKHVGLFIISCITEGTKSKYTYSKMCSQTRILRQPIMLPVTDNGTPDYNFMEQYIKEREEKLKQRYIDFIGENYQIGGVERPPEDKTWGVFQISDLFDIYTGTDLIISRIENGNIPVISHSSVNNGIACYSAIIENRKLFSHSNTISLADRGNFKAFVQKTDFYIGTRVKALTAKIILSKKALAFIANSIDKQAVKFSYGYNACDNIDNLRILLPTTDDGQPDYDYMEKYVKFVICQKYKKYLEYYRK